MQTTVTRQCPLPGFEAVAITYNLMATEEELDAFQKTWARSGARIVQSVEGWPGGAWGDDPFGKPVPMLFRVWAIKQVALAIAEYMADPKS
jgi:hypothetical protein